MCPLECPKAGNPPFSWEDSARDALIHEGFGGQSDWSVPQMLFRWETYNGMGYRPFAVPSPYLWSFSNVYDHGKICRGRPFRSQCRVQAVRRGRDAEGAGVAPGPAL